MTDKMDLTELLRLRHRIRIKWAEMPVDDPRLEWLYMRIRAELKKRREGNTNGGHTNEV